MSLIPGKKVAKHEVVVIASAPAVSGEAAGPLEAPTAHDLISAAQAIGLTIRPVFPDATIHAPTLKAAGATPPSPELAAIEQEQKRFFVAHTTTDEEAQRVRAQLKALPGVSRVYVKRPVECPLAPPFALRPAATAVIPDFTPRQGYLDAAPGGVGARIAWGIEGGKGNGVRFVDIEGGWTLEHVDLRGNSGGLVGGQAYTDADWTNHGTAVLGEIRGDDNGFGITGIAPETTFSVISHQDLGSAGAIDLAAGRLGAGDIILLEMHRPGPRFAFATRDDQLGYIAVEWWPDDFLAIRHAVLQGIIVIEAAGNGAQDFDDSFYDQPDLGFPDSWKNPFRSAADSGAIMVGAGAPPSTLYGPDRSRLEFSNFGSRVDCQGWGRGVVSTGYGDLYGGADDAFRTMAYTAEFSGTSSASPIVAGVVACLQGIARASSGSLSPNKVRDLLRETGSPQVAGSVGGPSQQIGNRPDLAQLIARIRGMDRSS